MFLSLSLSLLLFHLLFSLSLNYFIFLFLNYYLSLSLCPQLQSDIEFDINDLSSNHTSLSGGSSRTQYYPLDDSVTSELSSLKETGLFFIPPDQLLDITDELKPIRSVEVRERGKEGGRGREGRGEGE